MSEVPLHKAFSLTFDVRPPSHSRLQKGFLNNPDPNNATYGRYYPRDIEEVLHIRQRKGG